MNFFHDTSLWTTNPDTLKTCTLQTVSNSWSHRSACNFCSCKLFFRLNVLEPQDWKCVFVVVKFPLSAFTHQFYKQRKTMSWKTPKHIAERMDLKLVLPNGVGSAWSSLHCPHVAALSNTTVTLKGYEPQLSAPLKYPIKKRAACSDWPALFCWSPLSSKHELALNY